MKYKAIFLDIDNTLLDFDAYVRQTLEEGLAHFGLRPYEDWMYQAFHEENNKLWRQIEEGTLTFDELQRIRFQKVFARFEVDFDGPTFEKYFRAQLRECAIPVTGCYYLLNALIGRPDFGDLPGEREAIQRAKAEGEKPLLCVATNGPFEQQCHRIEIGNMAAYFDYYFVSEDLGVSKPDVAFFDGAFTRMNAKRAELGQPEISPEECAIIGDSMTSDMAGGRNAGMHTVFYNRGKKELTSDWRPDEVFDSLTEMADALVGKRF